MRSPNIIVFHADAWDGRQLSCLGNTPAVRTPNADRLAAESAHFSHACCHSPLCSPSRSSLWSGRHVHEIGAWNNGRGIGPEDSVFSGAKTELVDRVPEHPTLMGDLRAAGWRTNLVGTLDFTDGNHSMGARLSGWLRTAGLCPSANGGPRTDVRGEGFRANEADWKFIDAATEWLGGAEGPFFLSVGVRCPHPFRTTSRYWLDQIDAERIELPRADESDHPVMAFTRKSRGCDRAFSEEEIRFLRRRYYAMIAEADAMLGAVLDAVDSAGLADNTYFVFLSDHGEMNMEHNMVYKSLFYEPSLRVPMMVRGPGIGAGRRITAPVSLVDVYPTVMELAGLAPDREFEGQSLVPAATGAAGEADLAGEVFGEYHANDVPCGAFMVRTERWKYVAYPGYPGQLFDLENDPEELHNRVESEPEVAARLHARIENYADIGAVDRKAREEDREGFRSWREEVPPDEYRKQMANLFGEWTDADERAVVEWMEGEG